VIIKSFLSRITLHQSKIS